MFKPVPEAFVIVLVLLIPVTADPITRCLCSLLVSKMWYLFLKENVLKKYTSLDGALPMQYRGPKQKT